MFVLKATYGPPDMGIDSLYSESPVQRNYLVEVEKVESAQRLMADGYELIEDPEGVIGSSRKPLSPEDVADLLSIAKSTVYKYMKNGKLRATKDAGTGKFTISQSSVSDYIASEASAVA